MPRRQTANIQRRPRVSDAPRPWWRRGGRVDVRLVAAGVVLGMAAIGLVLVVVLAAGNDQIGQAVRSAGQTHIDDGTTPPAGSYTSIPATSGPHWGSPANWGVYPNPVPEAQVIHNLEHGGIVIWYDPTRLPAEDVADLASFVRTEVDGTRFKFILSPWAGEDFGHAIAVTAWTRLLYLDEVDMDQVRAFADRYYQRLGPEPGGGPPAP